MNRRNVVIIGIVSFLCVLFLSHIRVVEEFGWKIIDYEKRLFEDNTSAGDIILVCIDDTSLKILGRYPWRRKMYAIFLSGLQHHLPETVGFDILFTEEGEGDKELAYYASVLGNVVFGAYIDSGGRLVYPVEELRRVSSSGILNVNYESDGVLRRIPLVFKVGNRYYPSFVLQVILESLDVDFSSVKIRKGRIIVPSGNSSLSIPVDKDWNMWINYPCRFERCKKLSFAEVINWLKNKDNRLEKLEGKILLVGTSFTGGPDLAATPFGTEQPLIAAQSGAIQTILRKDFLYRIPESCELIFSIILAVFITVITYKYRPGTAVLSFCIGLVFLISLQVGLFMNNIILLLPLPFLSFLIPWFSLSIYKHIHTEYERRMIKAAFSRYLAPELIGQILQNPDKLRLGGEEKIVTVMFIDICGFTGLCERYRAEEVVGILNKGFDWITEVILKHKGLLDKYIGDAVMAIFGAPVQMEERIQVENAVRCAVEIVQRWDKWSAEEGINLGIGIGINTGPAVVGNMGSRYIFDYTAIGDTVNTGMRVESLTRDYRTEIIITDGVYRFLPEDLQHRFSYLGEVSVKGKGIPVMIYGFWDR